MMSTKNKNKISKGYCNEADMVKALVAMKVPAVTAGDLAQLFFQHVPDGEAVHLAQHMKTHEKSFQKAIDLEEDMQVQSRKNRCC